MLSGPLEIRVRIYGNRSPQSSTGVIQVQLWPKKERTLRALKIGGVCWGAALISVIFPLIHFFLVPGFLIAGPVVAFFIMGQESVVLGGSGTCPECQASLPIARTSYEFPISDLCTQCQANLKIEMEGKLT